MKSIKKAVFGMTAAIVLAGATAGSAQASEVTSPKAKLPVVAGAQSITKSEKAETAGEGLITINLLNNASILNNLNLLNIGSFNKWIKSN